MKVKLSSKAAASFSRTISELAAKGLKRTDRRYLVWFDANRYCGIGTAFRDDRASKANRNNGRPYGPAAYSRVDRQCWGLHSTAYHSVEAHELMHNLGAVQYSAPHSTKAGHCFDEYDVMCYSDGGTRSTMKIHCSGKSNDAWLDCRKNDYFNVTPKAGTYLATHWNVARSSFLNASTTSDPILTAVTATPLAGSLADPTGEVRLAWTVVADATIARTELERAVDDGPFAPWVTLAGASLTTTEELERGHTYRFRVTVRDSVGRRSFGREAPPVELERDLPPTVSTPTATIGYNAATTSIVDVEWWADDPDGWVVLAEVERSTDGTTWLPSWSGDNNTASITVASGATYRFRVRAKDDVGQWGAWSVSEPIVVPVGPADLPPEITSPPVASVSHAAGTTTYLDLSWDATDDRGVERATVEVRADGGAWTLALADASPTWAEVPVAQGHSYTFRVTVFDVIGQASAPAVSDPLVGAGRPPAGHLERADGDACLVDLERPEPAARPGRVRRERRDGDRPRGALARADRDGPVDGRERLVAPGLGADHRHGAAGSHVLVPPGRRRRGRTHRWQGHVVGTRDRLTAAPLHLGGGGRDHAGVPVDRRRLGRGDGLVRQLPGDLDGRPDVRRRRGDLGVGRRRRRRRGDAVGPGRRQLPFPGRGVQRRGPRLRAGNHERPRRARHRPLTAARPDRLRAAPGCAAPPGPGRRTRRRPCRADTFVQRNSRRSPAIGRRPFDRALQASSSATAGPRAASSAAVADRAARRPAGVSGAGPGVASGPRTRSR